MEVFEKLKKYYLLFALDEPFDIGFLVTSISEELGKLNKVELKLKLKELIKFFIESELFELGDTDDQLRFKKFDESLGQNLDRVTYVLENDLYHAYVLLIALTPKGLKEAKKYYFKKIQLEENIVIKGKTNERSIKSIIEIVSHEFDSNDLDEICYETIDALYSLVDGHYIEVGYLYKYRHFSSIFIRPCELEEKIKLDFKKIKNDPDTQDVTWFRNTGAANALIDKWEQCGGNLVEKWYKF